MRRIRNKLGRNFKSKRLVDKISITNRSLLMSKIRSKGTKLENEFEALLKKVTRTKFETHMKELPGTPDIIFKKQKLCVFIDSDFWHGWQFPRWEHKMKNDFWKLKIANNRARDKKVTRALRDKGWIVMRVWEHDLKEKQERVLKKIVKIL